MVSVTGVKEHLRRLRKIRGPAMINAVTNALYGGAQDIQVAAQISISQGATSGKNHVASSPGEPPNNDSGVLAGNIEAAVAGPLKAETTSNAPYGAAQEFGSEAINLPERPYMRPAAKRSREKVRNRVIRAVDSVVSRSG